MPRKKTARVDNTRPKPDKPMPRRAARTAATRTPAQRTASPVDLDIPAIAQTPPTNNDAADVPALPLFWAWYKAGVDTARLGFDIQTACVRQLMQASPAWLAYSALHGRALA